MTDERQTKTEIIESENVLAAFDPIEADIRRYKEENARLAFDYEGPDGNKAARSHIYKLRQIKSRVGDVHKKAKADALKMCRKVDAAKNRLVDAVEEMIDVHATPIKAIEERKAREIAEQQRIAREAAEKAERERQEQIEKRESELRRKEEELAAKQAEIDRQEREIREAEEKRIADLKAAEEKARREAAEKEAAEHRRIAAEKAEAERLSAIEKKRQENITHRVKVNNNVLGIFLRFGMTEENGKALVTEISTGTHPTLTINY